MSPKARLTFSLLGYGVLAYIFIQLPSYLYEPTRSFYLPTLLWLIHLIELYIHEAGHVIFSAFGETVYFLGGSIMQVLVPAVWLGIALREHSRLAPTAMFFTGENLVDVSVYARDAGTRFLPLIGGKHDWATVLSKADMLDWSVPLGDLFFFSGLTISLSALGWGIFVAFRSYRAAGVSP